MSKKRGKINKQVKKVFNGEGFDQGVATLDTDLLVELSMFCELRPDSLEREDLLRAIRSHWSQTKMNVRKAMLNFIVNKRQPTYNEEAGYSERIAKIKELLQPYGATPEERYEVTERLKELKSKKITEKKVKNTLEYLRFAKTATKLEEHTGVAIDEEGGGEFLHVYLFTPYGEEFHKELVTLLPAQKEFAQLNFEQKEQNLLQRREQAAAEKQQEIAQLCRELPRTHRYLSREQLLDTLKGLDPVDEIEAPPVALQTLQSILKGYELRAERDGFLATKSMHVTLYGKKLHYPESIQLEKSTLYRQIFYGEELELEEQFEQKAQQTQSRFMLQVEALHDELVLMAQGLEVDSGVIEDFILRYFQSDLQKRGKLFLRVKVQRRILYHFREYLQPIKNRYQRQQLLKKTVRDFKNLFPVARELGRKIIFHVGPTNSGKTYAALQKLQNADTGYYLAPLRLLALEGYESMRSSGIACSLITGEEEIIDEESTHISSTIEMMNYAFDVDCCVIDEAQMLSDRDRGWAWVNAIIGAPAKELYLTGSQNALEAVKEIAAWLGEELEIVCFERKNALEVLPLPIDLDRVEPQTALVAFSRKDVLALKQRMAKNYTVSVVYGNLSPEVRREEARRFREGESQILIATDAIAMGLNLPIKTLLFTKESKFDGESVRQLTSDEVLQIAGRAGRYGMEEVGYVGGVNSAVHKVIQKRMQGELKPIKSPFTVMANLEHIRLVAEILQTRSLYEILDFFAKNMKFEGPFVAKKLDQMIEIAKITDSYELELETKYHLSCAPVSINSPYIESIFHEYILSLEKGSPVRYKPMRSLPAYAKTSTMLLNAEDRVKEISLYLWLSFKFPDIFTDVERVTQARKTLNDFIESSLKFSQFIKRCKRCGKVLDFNFKYKICESCFNRGKKRRR